MRVENACERGTPDLYLSHWNSGSLDNWAIWVECKTANTPKSDEHSLTGFDIRADQKKWHIECMDKACDLPFFLFQIGGGVKARRYMVNGAFIVREKKITEGLLKRMDVLRKYQIC